MLRTTKIQGDCKVEFKLNSGKTLTVEMNNDSDSFKLEKSDYHELETLNKISQVSKLLAEISERTGISYEDLTSEHSMIRSLVKKNS